MIRFKIIEGSGSIMRGYKSQSSTVLEDIYVEHISMEQALNDFLIGIKEENIVRIKIHPKQMIAEVRYRE